MSDWHFIHGDGTFALKDPDQTSYLYFPLANERGMMSAITPQLHGDSKSSQNTFLLQPTSVEDLHAGRTSRNFWIYTEEEGPWSVAGASAKQLAARYTDNRDQVELEAGFLWQTVKRSNQRQQIEVQVTSFVPATTSLQELMKVQIKNVGEKELVITPTAAIPIYGRSADNLRDHRHVTALLNRAWTTDFGVVMQPTLSFDERGHKPNTVAYSVQGIDDQGRAPIGFFPILQEFTGEGGTLDWPEVVVQNKAPLAQSGEKFEGYEMMAGLRFATESLQPGEERTYIITMLIDEEGTSANDGVVTQEEFERLLIENKEFWRDKLDQLQFRSGDVEYDLWLKWVTLQPILRRIYGCSFLPYHDYGRGGRGWRDLWQDLLALLIMEPSNVRYLLYNNFAGIRIDGSNATIIGSQPGEFKADRNNITRIWIDHGAWPLLTTQLYLDLSGDLKFLLEEQTYFKDGLTSFTKGIDKQWNPEKGNLLRDQQGKIHRGSIMEHLLLQNLVPFFNVGQHNNIRIEDADWNDSLDMASEQGESVAFTAFYAGNLVDLIELLEDIQDRLGLQELELTTEMVSLLDTLTEAIDYNSPEAKQGHLQSYFASCSHAVSGQKVKVAIADLMQDLKLKSQWMYDHLRQQEWISNSQGYSWFNGYYDNDGVAVEGEQPNGQTRMTLTGQVFPIMSGVATEEQIREITRTADAYLHDPAVGGYRLNTNFDEVKLNLGRGFGFAYGHKENGAMFSHMAVMYAYGLYKRGFAAAGWQVLKTIFDHCRDFEKSQMYPGIPEYIDPKGRGLYPYLTGSASWYMLTMVTQVYGVQGNLGDLQLVPQLMLEQFDAQGQAAVKMIFADQPVEIVYSNPQGLDVTKYQISQVQLNGNKVAFKRQKKGVAIQRAELLGHFKDSTNLLEVELTAAEEQKKMEEIEWVS